MLLLRDSSPIPLECLGSVLALGNFDGLHAGHVSVIGTALALARYADRPMGVMTFEPHPRRVFNPSLPTLRILPFSEKLRLLRAMGVDFVRVVRFTRKFAQTAAPEFIVRDLHEALEVAHVVTGDDFLFGNNREGSSAMLHAMALALGFAATACPQVDVDGERCSSTRIREDLAEGKVEAAARQLGRPYRFAGHVQQGDKRGRALGFATANLFLPPVFLPAFGIYAARATVRGKPVDGVANLGVSPTFGHTRPRLEMHLFDWSGDIYGERIEVELMRFIRPERKFDAVEALKQQIAQDCEQARALLKAE